MEDTWNRQKIADEKRKWSVKFFKPSGKPDKLRRPGRPWESKAYAGAEKATFCGGTANLFAAASDSEKLRVGSNESISKLMQKLQLQSYHNQVQQVSERSERALMKTRIRASEQQAKRAASEAS